MGEAREEKGHSCLIFLSQKEGVDFPNPPSVFAWLPLGMLHMLDPAEINWVEFKGKNTKTPGRERDLGVTGTNQVELRGATADGKLGPILETFRGAMKAWLSPGRRERREGEGLRENKW